MDDFMQKLKKVVRIVLYGLAISQSDARKPVIRVCTEKMIGHQYGEYGQKHIFKL